MAQPLINFQDAVTASNLDPNAKYAVYYVDGRFANYSAVRARCPHAKLFGITTTGRTGPGVFAADSETGDLTVAQTLQWVGVQVRLRVDPIAVYANANRWLNEGLLSGLAHYGHRIKRWDANWNGDPGSRPAWADADQYAAPGPVDLNVALQSFFEPSQPAPPPPVSWWSAEVQMSVPAGSSGVAHFHGSVDLATGKWTAGGSPGVMHWTGPGGGQWRIKGIPLNSPPLGD